MITVYALDINKKKSILQEIIFNVYCEKIQCYQQINPTHFLFQLSTLSL